MHRCRRTGTLQGVRRAAIRTVGTVVVALAFAAASGCGVDDEPKKPSKRAPSSAVATCAGYECKVRIKCKGKVYLRFGPAPVKVNTAKTALRTTVYADFAGSSQDAEVRC